MEIITNFLVLESLLFKFRFLSVSFIQPFFFFFAQLVKKPAAPVMILKIIYTLHIHI